MTGFVPGCSSVSPLLVNNGGYSRFVSLPGAIPYGSLTFEGGLMTVPEGLEDLTIPCTEVLSVSGFSAFRLLFPQGRGFILRERACRISHVLSIIDVSDINNGCDS